MLPALWWANGKLPSGHIEMYEIFGGLPRRARPVGEQEVRQEGPQEQVPQAQGPAQLPGNVRPVLNLATECLQACVKPCDLRILKLEAYNMKGWWLPWGLLR